MMTPNLPQCFLIVYNCSIITWITIKKLSDKNNELNYLNTNKVYDDYNSKNLYE